MIINIFNLKYIFIQTECGKCECITTLGQRKPYHSSKLLLLTLLTQQNTTIWVEVMVQEPLSISIRTAKQLYRASWHPWGWTTHFFIGI